MVVDDVVLVLVDVVVELLVDEDVVVVVDDDVDVELLVEVIVELLVEVIVELLVVVIVELLVDVSVALLVVVVVVDVVVVVANIDTTDDTLIAAVSLHTSKSSCVASSFSASAMTSSGSAVPNTTLVTTSAPRRDVGGNKRSCSMSMGFCCVVLSTLGSSIAGLVSSSASVSCSVQDGSFSAFLRRRERRQ